MNLHLGFLAFTESKGAQVKVRKWSHIHMLRPGRNTVWANFPLYSPGASLWRNFISLWYPPAFTKAIKPIHIHNNKTNGSILMKCIAALTFSWTHSFHVQLGYSKRRNVGFKKQTFCQHHACFSFSPKHRIGCVKTNLCSHSMLFQHEEQRNALAARVWLTTCFLTNTMESSACAATQLSRPSLSIFIKSIHWWSLKKELNFRYEKLAPSVLSCHLISVNQNTGGEAEARRKLRVRFSMKQRRQWDSSFFLAPFPC